MWSVSELSFNLCFVSCVFSCFVARLSALKEPVYSQKEADMAAGMGNYIIRSPDSQVDGNSDSAAMATS